MAWPAAGIQAGQPQRAHQRLSRFQPRQPSGRSRLVSSRQLLCWLSPSALEQLAVAARSLGDRRRAAPAGGCSPGCRARAGSASGADSRAAVPAAHPGSLASLARLWPDSTCSAARADLVERRGIEQRAPDHDLEVRGHRCTSAWRPARSCPRRPCPARRSGGSGRGAATVAPGPLRSAGHRAGRRRGSRPRSGVGERETGSGGDAKTRRCGCVSSGCLASCAAGCSSTFNALCSIFSSLLRICSYSARVSSSGSTPSSSCSTWRQRS